MRTRLAGYHASCCEREHSGTKNIFLRFSLDFLILNHQQHSQSNQYIAEVVPVV